MKENSLTLKKKIFFTLLTGVFVILVISVLGEVLVRNFYPQVIMGPRVNYSEKYGIIWPKNIIISNELPGEWEFTYTTNENHSRGKVLSLSNSYDKKNIVVLGDSYAFGQGVNDNEEFASVLAQKLKEDYNIINLSVTGWALTQQIRRFYEFGQLYNPELVILQFCENDPWGNLYFKVTEIENGKFVFKNSKNSANKLKRSLSNSFIQKSCFYSLIRKLISGSFLNEKMIGNVLGENTDASKTHKISKREQFHLDLLELFSKDLNEKGITLFLIAPHNEIDLYPSIKEKVAELDSLGYLTYYETEDWFESGVDYSSPEGHHWGTKGHYVIGEKLSEIIAVKYSLLENNANDAK
jgi:lysophospholipase L1-like esterase